MRVHEKPIAADNAVIIYDDILSANSEAVRTTHYIILDNVKEIPANSFYNCTQLRKIILPDTICEIQHDAFNGCKNLEFRLPESVKFLGTRAFASVKSNCELVIPGTIHTIRPDCFMYTKFKSIIIEEGITHLTDVFRGAKIGKLVLPRSLESMAVNNLKACEEVVYCVDSPMEDFCIKNFTGKLSVRGGFINEEYKADRKQLVTV